MKKILIILFLYILVEGNNIIGDGLYVYHRGKHAVNELATKVDEYYPKVQAIDTVMTEAIEKQMYSPPETVPTFIDTIPSVVRRRRESTEKVNWGFILLHHIAVNH